MSDKGNSLEDSKSKSQHVSRSKKRWRKLEARREPARHYLEALGATIDANKQNEECKVAVF
jgi:predicted nucleotidyltransferase